MVEDGSKKYKYKCTYKYKYKYKYKKKGQFQGTKLYKKSMYIH
jgi:hypothetical protein